MVGSRIFRSIPAGLPTSFKRNSSPCRSKKSPTEMDAGRLGLFEVLIGKGLQTPPPTATGRRTVNKKTGNSGRHLIGIRQNHTVIAIATTKYNRQLIGSGILENDERTLAQL